MLRYPIFEEELMLVLDRLVLLIERLFFVIFVALFDLVVDEWVDDFVAHSMFVIYAFSIDEIWKIQDFNDVLMSQYQ